MSTFLLDCDGVLADFTKKALSWINTELKYEYSEYQALEECVEPEPFQERTVDEITSYDIFEALKLKRLEEKFWRELTTTPGWCFELELHLGAPELVEMLRAIGRVVCVTAPVSGMYWAGERREWLYKHFGFKPKDIVLASDKTLIKGDVLIDDSPVHIVQWNRTPPMTTPCQRGILWDQPWNRTLEHVAQVDRASSLEQLKQLLLH